MFAQDLSNASDYQAVLDAGFTEFLIRQQASKKTSTNYRADVRHFLSWLLASSTMPSLKHDLSMVTRETIENYKQSLVLAKTPASTINRRLSALRMFFQYATVNGFVQENSALGVRNIPKALGDLTQQSVDELTESYVREQAATPGFALTDSDDIREFMSWLTQNAIP